MIASQFKNCRIATLTDGDNRRTANVKDDSIDNEDDSNEDLFEDELPPGVDDENIQSDETEPDVLPKMVCKEETLRTLIHNLCNKYIDIFSRKMHKDPAKLVPLSLEVDTTKWFQRGHALPPREMSPSKQDAVYDTTKNMLNNGLIELSQARAWSQVVLAKKPNGTWRFCVDYRALNDCLKALGWPIPNIKSLFQRLGNRKARYFAVVDLTQGYW
jgi:hypothetical protein